jgi:hypothetical protein
MITDRKQKSSPQGNPKFDQCGKSLRLTQVKWRHTGERGQLRNLEGIDQTYYKELELRREDFQHKTQLTNNGCVHA